MSLCRIFYSNPHANRFKNITQQGVFAEIELNYSRLSLAYSFAMFDRFDANVYAKFIDRKTNSNFDGKSLQQLENMHQYTNTINFKYHFNSAVSLQANYQASNTSLHNR